MMFRAQTSAPRRKRRENVLMLVHIEDDFRRFFPDPLYTSRVMRSVDAKKYDRVIVLYSEITDIIWEVRSPRAEIWSWGWGYYPGVDYLGEGENDWIIPSNSSHEWTWVPPELRENQCDLKMCNIYVGGGWRWECLQDWLDVLDYMHLPYKLVDGLVYGN